MAKGSEKHLEKKSKAAPVKKKEASQRGSDKKSKKNSQKEEEPDVPATTNHVIKPKRFTTSWVFFNTETVAKLKKEGIDHSQAFKKSSEIWKELSDKKKEPYAKK